MYDVVYTLTSMINILIIKELIVTLMIKPINKQLLIKRKIKQQDSNLIKRQSANSSKVKKKVFC